VAAVVAVIASFTAPAVADAGAGDEDRVAGADPAYLPNAACAPVDNPADDSANAFNGAGVQQVKVIYAHPSDRPNDFAAISPLLAEGVRNMVEYVYLESGDLKSVRFDLGTAAGRDCVDVQRVSLPNPSAYYDPEHASLARERVVADVEAVTGPAAGPRLNLIFADLPNLERSANTEPLPVDDSATGAAWQGGGYSAVVFERNYTDGLAAAFGEVGVHELWHMLGSVSSSAPNYGGGGHCIEQQDLMCDQIYGGPTICDYRQYETVEWRLIDAIDCGRDDYFSPSPAPGSYLATHWNTYDSPFLCAIGTCGPDNFAPSVTIRGKRVWKASRARFKLRASEPSVRFSCKIDNGGYRPCDPRYRTPPLPAGKHRLRVKGRDAAGNLGKADSIGFRLEP
jgi:hypothetical protein